MLDRLGAQRWVKSWPGTVMPQAGNAFGKVALLPTADRHVAHPDRPITEVQRSGHSVTLIRGISNRSVVRAYQPPPCIRPIRSSFGVSM
jgi:hypothetical protein